MNSRIVGVGTAVPEGVYSQTEILDRFGIKDSRVRSVFLNGGIDRRHLVLPPLAPGGRPAVESQGELLAKHVGSGLRLGREAISAALARAGARAADVRYLCCVSSTGFLTPGFSALLLKELDIPRDCARLDVVGMGCNAGLNALTVVADWASMHPSELAVMACIEVCSAAYVFDGTMRTSVVNSLFGDGAAAVAVRTGVGTGPAITDFASWIIPDAIDAMRYDWDDGNGKFSFSLATDVPYVVGANLHHPVSRLLRRAGLRRSEITHWVIHSGGKKVIDSARINLGLSRHDVRHTLSVLRDFGNLSSGSFLFSYQRLLEEGTARPGDVGVLMTMGPGSTIETALVPW